MKKIKLLSMRIQNFKGFVLNKKKDAIGVCEDPTE